MSFTFSQQAEIDDTNMALGRLGCESVLTLAGYANDPNGLKAQLFFGETRDSLLRSFSWSFAKMQMRLASTWATGVSYGVGEFVFYPDTSSTSSIYKCATAHISGVFADDLTAVDWVVYTGRPLFKYAYQYDMPTTSLRLLKASMPRETYDLQSGEILTSATSVNIQYINQVTDPTLWDALFTEVFILKLALKLCPAIGGVSTGVLYQEITAELKDALMRARTVCANEVNSSGRNAWANARYGSGKIYSDAYKR